MPADLRRAVQALAVGLTLFAGRPAGADPTADAARVFQDLLAETRPAFLRDAGSGVYLAPKNRLVHGSTLARATSQPGVCALDAFDILALPEAERAQPEPGVAMIRQVEARRSYLLIEARPRAANATPQAERDRECAALGPHPGAPDPEPPRAFFWADSEGGVYLAGQVMAGIAGAPQGRDYAALLRDCRRQAGCGDAAALRDILRPASLSGFHDRSDCPRDRLCFSALLIDGDDWWSLEFDLDRHAPAFEDKPLAPHLKRQARIVLD